MKNLSLHITYHSFSSHDELDESDQLLIQAALKASENAYAPFSGFHVGAALKLGNGVIVTGNNQENAAFPSGLCAERVALFYAGSQHAGEPIDTLVVTARMPGKQLKEIVKPCGACRQVMLESTLRQNKPFRIILAGEDSAGLIFDSIHDLLPFSFIFE